MSFAIQTTSQGLQRALATSATDLTFTAKVQTITEPVNDGVINTGFGGATSQNILKVFPFGSTAADTTFDLRVIGWHRTPKGLWVPAALFECTCTLSTAAGVGSYEVASTDLVVDTIVAASAYTSVSSIEVVSPANNTQAYFVLDFKGFQKLEFIFDMTGATSGNVLITQY